MPTSNKARASRAKGSLLARYLVPPYKTVSAQLDSYGQATMTNRTGHCMLEVSVRAIRVRPRRGA